MTPDHDRQEDVGAYVLGALEEQEAAEFERHMATCHDCRDEADRLRGAVNAVARSVEPLQPPKALKKALLETAGAQGPDGAEERAPRKRSPLRVLLRPEVAWISAVLLLVLGGAGGFAISQLGEPEPAAPKERVLKARVDRDVLPRASAALRIGAQTDRARLTVHGLPVPRRAQVYELWLRHDGGIEPAGVFTVDRQGRGHAVVEGDLAGADAVMVTREPAGGVAQPSGAPVLTVQL
jgi:anti-sigma-K factor RskA